MRRPNCCDMPKPAPAGEAKIWSRFRDLIIKTHCSADRAHRCCGQITITASTVTFNCKLCGDARQVIAS